MSSNFAAPISSQSAFEQAITKAVEGFPNNRICKSILEGTASLQMYHRLLKILFHQVYFSSNTFAIAGSNLGTERTDARNYLLKHAEEEMDHWRWITSDLSKTGYTGAPPDTEFPHPAAQAYISFNFFIAHRMPIARLGIALMLETLGGTLGKQFILKWCQALKLGREQAVFFLGHGDTDVVHAQELKEIINKCNLTPAEWGWMKFAVECSYYLYFQMYEEAGR